MWICLVSSDPKYSYVLRPEGELLCFLLEPARIFVCLCVLPLSLCSSLIHICLSLPLSPLAFPPSLSLFLPLSPCLYISVPLLSSLSMPMLSSSLLFVRMLSCLSYSDFFPSWVDWTKPFTAIYLVQVTVDVELNDHWTDTITHWRDLHLRDKKP